jgi:hypothetical protein
MQYLLLGLVALVLGLMAAQAVTLSQPGVIARQLRSAAGLAAFLVGMVSLFRGAVLFGSILGGIGLWALLGHRVVWPGWSQAPSTYRPTSRIVTEHLDLELEHDSGAIQGSVLKGAFAGRELETLRPVELAHLWSDCQFIDPQSAQVLEAYLDRVHPTWREDMARADAGSHATGSADTAMSPAQALEILGLRAGATEAEIRHAHRELMLKLHPDRGGSHTLAAKVNEAKDVLLRT